VDKWIYQLTDEGLEFTVTLRGIRFYQDVELKKLVQLTLNDFAFADCLVTCVSLCPKIFEQASIIISPELSEEEG